MDTKQRKHNGENIKQRILQKGESTKQRLLQNSESYKTANPIICNFDEFDAEGTRGSVQW